MGRTVSKICHKAVENVTKYYTITSLKNMTWNQGKIKINGSAGVLSMEDDPGKLAQSKMTRDSLDPAPRLNIEVYPCLPLNQTYDWIWSVVCRRFTPILKRGRGAKHKTRNRIFLLVVFMRVDLCEITENQRPWFTSILKRGCGGQITKYEIRSLNKTHFDASRNLHFEKFAFWQFEKSILWELRILTAWEIDNLRNSQFSKCQNANSSNYWIIKMPKCEFLKM